jgi:diphthine methyl ester synthase
MTPAVALSQILSALGSPDVELSPKSTLSPIHTLALALSRVGTPTQSIRAGTLAQLATLPEDAFGPPLHSLVIVGSRVHPMEIEFATKWAIDGDWLRVARDVYAIEIGSE